MACIKPEQTLHSIIFNGISAVSFLKVSPLLLLSSGKLLLVVLLELCLSSFQFLSLFCSKSFLIEYFFDDAKLSANDQLTGLFPIRHISGGNICYWFASLLMILKLLYWILLKLTFFDLFSNDLHSMNGI